jgi:HAD superfamily hydrolase (TIGR01509 family)
LRFTTRVVQGCGEAAQFTSLDWVRARFREALGSDPYPGTLNAVPAGTVDREAWQSLRAEEGTSIAPPSAAWCAARGYRVRVGPRRITATGDPPAGDAGPVPPISKHGGRLPAAIIVPAVPGYPEDRIELIAALSVREAFGLSDGDALDIDVCPRVPARAVLFDVDGTLVDSLTAFRVVAESAAAPHGLTITDEVVREALNGGRSFWELVVPGDWTDRAAFVRSLSVEAARNWPAVLKAHGRLLPEVAAALGSLRARGAKLGIVTGAQRESLAPLRAEGLLELFGAVIAKEDVQRRKPDPEGLLKCASALGVEPGEAVYVGDTPLDVQAARAAGMRVLGVLSGAGDSRLLSTYGPDHLVSSVAALPQVIDVLA